MSESRVWFAIPSASPALCRETLPAWRERGYRVAVLQNRERGSIPADIVAWADSYPGWAASVNRLCREIVPEDAAVVVTGGDDMLPDPDHSAGDLLEQFIDRFPDTFGVMQPQGDGYMGARHYCGSPWIGRAFARRMYGGRGPMWPEYRHNWADNELYWVARGLHVLWERPDLVQHHEHFTRRGAIAPDYWSEQVQRHDRRDVQLFIARSWQRFPEHAPTGSHRRFDTTLFERENRAVAETYWLTRYGFGRLAETAHRRLGAAFDECVQRGLTRVALYGAGSQTQAAAPLLMQPPVSIVAIIDDDPARHGTRLWNYPIVSANDALRLDLDAVVLSTAVMEDELAAAAAPLERRGVEIIRPGVDHEHHPDIEPTHAS